MKTQRKPFQVEVKRGTSRSAFISPSQEPDVFRKAEAQLFRVTQPDEPVSDSVRSRGRTRYVVSFRRSKSLKLRCYRPPMRLQLDEDGSRDRKNKPKLTATVGVDGISRSLRLDDGLPTRRGRPPGSKNQVRQIDLPENAIWPSLTSVEAQEHASVGNGASPLSDLELVVRRRGRPPGSKNKPKESGTGPNIPTKLLTALKAAGVDVKADDVSISHQGGELGHVDQEALDVRSPRSTESSRSSRQGTRLRDRSKILRRYVLGTEPMAGERGHRRRKP